jgi:hypothetical protein
MLWTTKYMLKVSTIIEEPVLALVTRSHIEGALAIYSLRPSIEGVTTSGSKTKKHI